MTQLRPPATATINEQRAGPVRAHPRDLEAGPAIIVAPQLNPAADWGDIRLNILGRWRLEASGRPRLALEDPQMNRLKISEPAGELALIDAAPCELGTQTT